MGCCVVGSLVRAPGSFFDVEAESSASVVGELTFPGVGWLLSIAKHHTQTGGSKLKKSIVVSI